MQETCSFAIWDWVADWGAGAVDFEIGTQSSEPQDENSQRPWVQPTLMKSSLHTFLHQIIFQILLLALNTQKTRITAERSRCISKSQIIFFFQCNIIPENYSNNPILTFLKVKVIHPWYVCLVEVLELLNNNNKVFLGVANRCNLSLL